MQTRGLKKQHSVNVRRMRRTAKAFIRDVQARTIAGKEKVRRLNAIAWHRFDYVQFQTRGWLSRWGHHCVMLTLIALLVLSFVVASRFEPTFHWLGEKERLSSLQQLLVTLGGALIGGTAISFSLIMFAMQVNVDRMPHGLFRKLGTDRALLAAFVSAFVLAIGIASMSLVVEQIGVAKTLLLSLWGTVLVLLSFLYAYKRALDLISPYEQLRIVARAARADMAKWVMRAKRAEPLLLEQIVRAQGGDTKPNDAFDHCRSLFFLANPGWTGGALEALQYAVAFSRRFSELGDHDVATASLRAIIDINSSYVTAKGKTFFSSNPIFDNPGVTDGFINETLECMRQNIQMAVSRGDERHIEDAFHTIGGLAKTYLQIDYASQDASKTHALLASGYLATAVQDIAPRNMPDVLLEGLRCMGILSEQFVLKSAPNSIVSISEKIALIALTGAARADHIAVTSSGMERLSWLTTLLIQNSRHRDSRFAIHEVRDDIFRVSMLVFEMMSSTTMSSNHRTALAPFFSLTSVQSFASFFTNITNAIANISSEQEQAQQIVANVKDWSDGLYHLQKKLLLLAIAKRTTATSDLIQWTAHITKLLLAMSCSSVCDRHAAGALRENATWLISVLSWIPDDQESINYVNAFGIEDVLFEAADDARRRDCDEVSSDIFELLVSWAFKSGRYETGFASLETGLCGAIALCALGVVTKQNLAASISKFLLRAEVPDRETRFSAAEAIREAVDSAHSRGYSFSPIENAIARIDPDLLRPLCEEVADMLLV